MTAQIRDAAWWTAPMRVLDLVYCPQVAELDYEALGRQCREFNANVIHFHFHRDTLGGFQPSEIYCRTSIATRQNRDVLGEFLPIAKRLGVRVVLYVNGHWFNKEFVKTQPDWWVILEDGSRMDRLYGENDSSFCVNSPWRDWMKRRIEDLCAYDIDGLFWDGPVMFLNRKGCYCKWCRAKFAEAFNREMPAWDKSDAEGWPLLREFTIASLSDYYRDAYGWVKAIKPGAAVYMNAANVAEPAWIAGRDNHRLLPYADVLAAEGGFHYGRVAGDPWKTSASSKFYETQAGGKPALNAVSSAEGGFRRCQLGAAEMRVLLADASRGSNPYAAFFYEGLGQGGDAAARDVFAWLAANESVLRGTRSAARVALLSSTYTLETYGGVDIPWADISGMKAQGAEGPGNHSRSFYGFYEMLVRSRVPFDVIDDKAIESGGLGGYEWLVLPTAACLSRAECEAIERFARGGGKVIADFETSQYDERGQRQRQFQLAGVLGCDSLNSVVGPRNWDFARPAGAAPYLAAIGAPAVPATRHNLAVKNTTGQTRMVFSERVISNIPDRVDFTDEPFLIENAPGAGRCFYFTGTFGELYLERRFPGYARLFRGILEAHGAPSVKIENAEHLIEVNLRAADDGRRLLHLTNHELSGVETIVSAVDLKVTLRDSKPVRGVRALRGGRPLSFERRGEELTFSLPRLEEFEVVLIEG